ncbi:ricin-type beta-trefoil lectin domain protein [Dactylosporangium sp. CA-139066]|uniref:RICIN domain-containing protein n=1 Tax=Dactylosporangium sp. CA-139066 TaxID=3239930 RepID=UPI003D89E801
MSVAGDGKDAGESGGTAPASPSRARHRVPPPATAAASVLPAPFVPAKPTIPAIPHQRRPDGPTAIATASIPAEPPAASETLEFIVTLPGTEITNDPSLAPPPSSASPFSSSPDAPESSDAPDAAVASEEAVAPEEAVASEEVIAPEEAVETVEGELMPVGSPMSTVEPDDSPTIADVAPALAIVAEDEDEDGADYRGTRRRVAPWRRYPIGAVAVAVIILLVTGGVAIQLVRDGGSGGTHNEGLPGRVPGVNVPEPVAASPTPEDSASADSSPSAVASRSRAASASASHAPAASSSAPASSSPSAAPPPPPAPPTSGRMVGKQSHLCIEYRVSSRSVSLVLDTCDARATNQRFRVAGDPNKGALLVTDSGLCLDVQNAGTGNGNAVWVYACNNTPAQRWVHHPNDTWENPQSHRCLDAANGGTAIGTPLIIWDCKASDNQIWSMA